MAIPVLAEWTDVTVTTAATVGRETMAALQAMASEDKTAVTVPMEPTDVTGAMPGMAAAVERSR